MAHPIGKIIKTIITKQGLFLIGSTLILVTWYFQNIIEEEKNQKIHIVETGRNKFTDILNRIEINRAKLLEIDLFEKHSDSSSKYESFRLPIILDQFINFYYSKFAARDLNLDGIDIEVFDASDRIPSLESLNSIYNSKDIEKIMAQFLKTDKDYETLRQLVTWKFTTQIMILNDKDKNIHLYATFLFILGSILIACNRAIEYLESLKKTVVA